MTFPPHGLDAINATFGTAIAYHDRKDEWERLSLAYFDVPADLLLYLGRPVTRLRAHRLAGHWFQAALQHAHDLGCRNVEYGGVYNYRLKRTVAQPSTHSWGIAIDLNASRCPLGCDPAQQEERLVRAFARFGFTWGGEFTSGKDPMHWQLCSGW